ncbi:MAG TPA: tetratricopeptide repeat protein, partial [Terracidiphilus sp.]|nr:tetratricopeptide repeat protein [Terracidiphilus sp.]
MRVGRGAWKRVSIVAGCLLLALQLGLAQKKPVASTANTARSVLIDKARALESRGRPDMAVQLWQQILLSDPNNAEALAGVAKDFKLMGAADKANEALERLRKANPNDPNISRIEGLSSSHSESDQLRYAGELARQGRADDAMRIYRQVYGDHPLDGEIAMAYYQTLHATATGKAAAIAGMRGLAERNPGNPRYAIGLGVMLTYDGRTRAEGIHILQAHPKDSDAQTALRQALIWDSANPASAAQLRQYLKDHPQDAELAKSLKANELKLAQMNSGIARTPAERAAFAALNAHRLDEAQARFAELLKQAPKNGRMAAGMGFLRMQQKDFGSAISFLMQAEQNGYKARTVEDALAISRFWYIMAEAAQAFDENKLEVAAARYKGALIQNPRSPEALNGLAGLLTKQQQYSEAAGVYEQLIKVQPGNLDGWRGLFLAYARTDQNDKALATSALFPAQVKSELTRDPEYLRTLATIYQAQGRSADAQRVLAQALSLPFPDNGTSLNADTKLQYAGILMDAKRYDQAAALYVQILTENPSNVSAWMGLVSAYHELGQNTQAIAKVQKMPAATYDAALADPGFLSVLGAIYQQANQFEEAQRLLERSAKLQIAAGRQPGVALQLQLAAIYLLRNNTVQAYGIYRQVLKDNPDRAEAWKGLISTLLATNRNAEALQEIALIPAQARKQLESDIEFVQSEASLYAASGDNPHALEYMNRVQAHYIKLKIQPPANIDIQNAWLLYNVGDDRALYSALMRLGSRNDLTVVQREMIENIWANWSVRRAAAAMDNGNVRRAVDILDAASQAFPDNLSVRKAVAGGYALVGRAKESLKLFKAIPLQDATSGDFQGAIGAALQANDKTQAELWLRQALERYPRDPAILSLAARYEQARGDNQRAADYWRAALATMPARTPADKLANELVYPEQDLKAHRAVTAADLQHLLDPDYEPFAKTTRVPSQPAYGPDPYEGSAPAVLTQPQSQSSPQQSPATTGSNASSTSESKSPTAPDSNPAVRVIPTAQTPGPQLFHQQSAAHLEIGNLLSSQPAYGGLVVRDAIYHPNVFGQQATMATFQPAYDGAGNGSNGMASAEMQLASLQPTEFSEQAEGPSVPISANAPHSMASDAWKGLILSLMASNRNAEAIQTLAKIPPDVRRQLEADIEFVQGIASLYVAVGDSARATQYLNRVENVYLLHKTAAPAGLEVQHAWLLYSVKDDVALYTLLLRLDSRQDLDAALREQVGTLWANWAVRHAGAAIKPVTGATEGKKEAHDASGTRGSSGPPSYTGKVNLPPSEQTIDFTEPEAQSAHVQSLQPLQSWSPGTGSLDSNPALGLRITSQPMDSRAAQVQALFAEETDSQLTQGSISVVHVLWNSPVGPAVSQATSANHGAASADTGQYTEAQYTPSAQEAATGAYSVPKQQAAPPEKPAASTQPANSSAKRRKKSNRPVPQTNSQQTYSQQTNSEPSNPIPDYTPPLSSAPALPPAHQTESPQQAEAPSNAQAEPAAPAPSGAGLTDQELEQRNLPPLRGPWVRIQRDSRPTSPREEAELQLRSIESGYSGWLGGSGLINYRSGALGFD